MRQGVLISTTEHLLSAFIGMGIDNVIVELDNLELPILDGSALPYVEAFQSVGITGPASPPRVPPHPAQGRGARGRQVHRCLSRRRLQHRLRHRLPRTHRSSGISPSIWPQTPTAQRLPRRAPSASARTSRCCATWASSAALRRKTRSSSASNGVQNGPCALPTNSFATRCSISSATSPSPATASSAASSPSAPAMPCTPRSSRACSRDRSAWDLITLPQLEVTRRPARAARLSPVQV